LGSKLPNWNYPSVEYVRRAEHWVELEAKLPILLSGEAEPADNTERLIIAVMCIQHKKLNAAAVRFFRGAFLAEPKLAEEHRYNAACAAALAGCGQGRDAATLDDAERARLRQQSLDWLVADLAASAKLADNATDRPKLRQKLEHWQLDTDFAGIRGDAALAKLPEAERAAWQKLWADVAELLKRTGEPSAAAKPSKP
jgi:eukaryotic-like serine/threonine-protein kinase